MTVVRAPGSSANLGPGFDVLGAAISRYAWVSDEGPLIDRPNHSFEPISELHLVSVAHQVNGGTGPLWFAFDLRPGRGMGFSGAARAAAVVLAGLQRGDSLDEARAGAYVAVSRLEGHGDNAAPSVFGGVNVVAGRRRHRLPVGLPGELLLWVPDQVSSTDLSRESLLDEVYLGDAVFNIGHTALLVASLYESDPQLFAAACNDRLHQDQRFDELPESAKAAVAARSAGAMATWLSGAGPSIGILAAPAKIDAIVDALSFSGAVERVALDLDGAVLVP